MTVIRWVGVFLLLCLAMAVYGAGQVLGFLSDVADGGAECFVWWAAWIMP